MKELVEVIAKSLVDYPDEVNVTETENEKAIVLELRVAQSDMGKVIGKRLKNCKQIPNRNSLAQKILKHLLNLTKTKQLWYEFVHNDRV